ncbi:hypothetical protein GCM10010329_45770 [Streptomyces spiroverticillatus]|uniref:Uncharacterized protein n=1 Tax=Streptomyces finlayi TaxID=67296 RepID=A0A919CB29_9ACTN|nr:hypothetical protein [Streptomyces finlayi]GHA17546.1 hypothetical protein GCM10010329_45770 [Streptomyces spiroverticillatus]GHC99419.1 hypothetical protein GCM10010334_42940 [Streptomyces finlayi]
MKSRTSMNAGTSTTARTSTKARRSLTAALLAALALTAVPSAANAQSADPTPPPPPVGVQGLYISPWGSAEAEWGPEMRDWMEEEGIKVTAQAPFKVTKNGFRTPIGATEGDHLEFNTKARIFYPGGITLYHPRTKSTIKLDPTFITLVPPGWSTGLEINGKKVSDNYQVAYTTVHDVLLAGRPTFTGFTLHAVPFYLTPQFSALLSRTTKSEAPSLGTQIIRLTPKFDYVPTKRS